MRPTRVLSLGERMKCEFIIPISKFMELLVKQCSFSNISIKELPMEKVITKIYEKTK